MERFKKHGLPYVTAIVTVIYLIWRIFFTLPFQYGVLSMILGILLLLVEMSGLFEQVANTFMLPHKSQPSCEKIDESTYPTVDVFITTCTEPIELIYKTINGCVNMDYPDKDKVQIYVCDDGNRKDIYGLASKFHVHYLTREDNFGDKAGSLNNALERSNGQLIVTFDADMIPMHDFLTSCVPYFLQGEEIGFIQTPHNFYNPDLFQYNLYEENNIPNELNFFYHDVEIAKNQSNSTIYSGSNTILLRKALEEVGGFTTSVVTEDFATGMLIQSRGYQCYAIDQIHASGLAPQDLKNFTTQKRKWASGCIQAGKKLKLWRNKDLTYHQKLSYTTAILSCYSSSKQLLYMIIPLLFTVFNLVTVQSNLAGILFIWLPMYALNYLTANDIFGTRRSTRWRNIYDTVMAPLLFGTVLLETLGFSFSETLITKKEKGNQDKRYSLRMAIPHILLALFSIYGFISSIVMLFQTKNLTVLFLTLWIAFNLYYLILAIFFMFGREYHRNYERFPLTTECMLNNQGKLMYTTTSNLSENGCSIDFDSQQNMPTGSIIDFKIYTEHYHSKLEAKVLRVTRVEDRYRYAFCFEKMKEIEYRNLLHIIHDRIPPLTEHINKELKGYQIVDTNIRARLKVS